jgi:hypothetical protein
MASDFGLLVVPIAKCIGLVEEFIDLRREDSVVSSGFSVGSTEFEKYLHE